MIIVTIHFWSKTEKKWFVISVVSLAVWYLSTFKSYCLTFRELVFLLYITFDKIGVRAPRLSKALPQFFPSQAQVLHSPLTHRPLWRKKWPSIGKKIQSGEFKISFIYITQSILFTSSPIKCIIYYSIVSQCFFIIPFITYSSWVVWFQF